MRITNRLIAILMLLTTGIEAHGFSLLTWNANEGSVEAVTRREPDIQRLGTEIRSKLGGALPDVVVLQEVTSYAAAVRVARALGYTTGTLAASDSGKDRDIWPFALEVALVTTKQVVSITSYQSRADDRNPPFVADLATGDVTYGKVMPVTVPAAVALPGKETIPRAILRVELGDGIVIYGVHLNSSGLSFCRLEDAIEGANELRARAQGLGLTAEAKAIDGAVKRIRAAMGKARNPGVEATKQEALRRARSREAAAGAIAVMAAADVKAGKSVFVAGDFNTPLSEPCKTGNRLDEDFEPMIGCATRIDPSTCGTKDGFDDTYAVLTTGVIENMRFRVLTESLGRTYASDLFVDSPIDNVLVAGQASQASYQAIKIPDEMGQRPYGSDHFPVLVRTQP